MANNDRTAVQSGLNDILGNVIQNDRRRSGRSEEQSPPAPTDPTTPAAQIDDTASKATPKSTPDIMTGVTEIAEAPNNTLTQSGNMTPKTAMKKRPGKSEGEPAQEASVLDTRIHEAQVMADSPTTTVTLRIPHALNNWLDEYVHGSWPEKVKKQQLVTEALQLLYARRGKPKEEILPTPLFPEKQ